MRKGEEFRLLPKELSDPGNITCILCTKKNWRMCSGVDTKVLNHKGQEYNCGGGKVFSLGHIFLLIPVPQELPSWHRPLEMILICFSDDS